ncbi:histidine kinase [Sparassis crispa]|uniref:Histidine kinase n=1 Tax=Sparassis crispa TaxID=139825 RepID=A0A401GU17_9APHY|nr:histidine kinase [Sparassis crispa]GBE85224.1 histidine kinase [Sparassis crispa]
MSSPDDDTARKGRGLNLDLSTLAESAPTTSYVYPVRSSLSGIQPSAGSPGKIDESNNAVVPEINVTKSSSRHETQISDRESIHEDEGSPSTLLSRAALAFHFESLQGDYPQHGTPNFRDFSHEEDPLFPRTLSTMPPGYMSSVDVNCDKFFTSEPTGEPVGLTVTQSDEGNCQDDAFNARHPAQFSEVAADAFAEVAPASMLLPTLTIERDNGRVPFFISQSGIVHLPPIEATSSPPSLCTRSSASSRGRASSPLAIDSGDGSLPQYVQLLDTGHTPVDVIHLPSAQGSPQMVTTGSGSSMMSSVSEGPHITFRYQHMEDENGHHLIVGREGKLTKCEDEPIRTPGAVQGFGILIAVEEDDDTGSLVVRQVSENSTELLGLSPQYLFSLECFSQTLPDQQVDILFDNIQYLSDASLTPEEQAENLHVFMLSGYGEPETALLDDLTSDVQRRRTWTCWCAAHRPQMTASANVAGNEADDSSLGNSSIYRNLIILEFELDRDTFNPLYPPMLSEGSSFQSGISSPSDGSTSTSNSSGRTLVSTSSEERDLSPGLVNSDPSPSASISGTSPTPSSRDGMGFSLSSSLSNADHWIPSSEDILESTTSHSRPLLALERLRRTRRSTTDSPASPGSYLERGTFRPRRGAGRRRGAGAVGMMDVFAVMAQINEQLGAAPDLDTFLKVVAGVVKDLAQFHRVLVYQFDELWNGKVVAELVDWNQTNDLYRGLHFPAADIPPQARTLYALNKVRLLYDRGQPTARLVVRSRKDLETPLDMTHCYLRAMSPIHLKYLENMGVRASMSVSIIAFGTLWGLVACHSYGPHGMRVSFPVRQMLRLLSQSISRNIERLSYAQRLHIRKLINTMPSDQHPSGYIVSNADDLLGLFDADYGVLVIGEGAKILGLNQHGQEILIVAEYLRLKQFNTIQVSQAVTQDYPDLHLTTGLEVIAGLLYVPLSGGGRDFIAFLRKGQPRQVNWAGRPFKEGEQKNTLEPRTSFRIWSETVAGRCRAWADEHLETAGVLALVYGKFIEVWRQKESALQTTKLTNILLSNASHEVRTPLNHIINYLELAMNGPLDFDTRENLSQSHAASKSLLFTINDLLDLTRFESGNETSFNELFDLHRAVDEATLLYKNEAHRRGLGFVVDLVDSPKMVLGDARKIRTVVANLTANALKYTTHGSISVECHVFEEPVGLRSDDNVAVEIVVSDTGCGIPSEKLESIFREFEQVESASPKSPSQGLGLGLAIVARIVEQLGGQLRVDSKIDEGSRFSFLIPFATDIDTVGLPSVSNSAYSSSRSSLQLRSRNNSRGSGGGQIDDLVEALSTTHMDSQISRNDVVNASTSVRAKEDSVESIPSASFPETKEDNRGSTAVIHRKTLSKGSTNSQKRSPGGRRSMSDGGVATRLRILIVEDNDINRMILAKRLALDGHMVINTTNGQEGVEMLETDWEFDCILMDIQMPLLNGYEATERIRMMEEKRNGVPYRLSHKLNGRIPIFAVSASLYETRREEMYNRGLDGWILKPIDFKRLRVLLRGVIDISQRQKDVYHPGCSWETGGWLTVLSSASDDSL